MPPTHLFFLETPRLWLLNADRPVLASLFQGNAQLSEHLQVAVPENWTENGEPAFRWTETALEKQPGAARWFTYLPVLKSENMLIGSCGFTGPPTDEGVVEMGYEISETHRNRGLATEIVRAFVSFALSDARVLRVRAHTLPFENASNSILIKCGFAHVGDSVDPDEGTVWRWELGKN